jgi:hypothetical protein
LDLSLLSGPQHQFQLFHPLRVLLNEWLLEEEEEEGRSDEKEGRQRSDLQELDSHLAIVVSHGKSALGGKVILVQIRRADLGEGHKGR